MFQGKLKTSLRVVTSLTFSLALVTQTLAASVCNINETCRLEKGNEAYINVSPATGYKYLCDVSADVILTCFNFEGVKGYTIDNILSSGKTCSHSATIDIRGHFTQTINNEPLAGQIKFANSGGFLSGGGSVICSPE